VLSVQGVVAGSLCNWSQDSGVIPVNKNLWYDHLAVVDLPCSVIFILHCESKKTGPLFYSL